MDKLISDVINSSSAYWENKRKMNVITIYDDEIVLDALKLLASHNILSLPVKERSTDYYLGFIDMQDILHSIIESFLERNPQKEGHDWSRLCQDVSESNKFANQPVKNLINQSKRDNFIPADESGSIHQLIDEIFSKGIHRVVVIDENANTKGIISQTDILEYILENRNEIEHNEDFDKPVLEIKDLVQKDVLSINSDVMAIQCYYIMMKHNKPSIALTGSKGEIVGNLSITDLRGLDPDSFKLLLEPAIEFWKQTNEKQIDVLPSTTTFKEIIKLLYKNRLHRIWISCSETGGCFGMITIGNIMKFFSRDQHDINLRNSLSSLSSSSNSLTNSANKTSTPIASSQSVRINSKSTTKICETVIEGKTSTIKK